MRTNAQNKMEKNCAIFGSYKMVWIDECKRLITSLDNVTIRKPKAILIERTAEISEWNEDAHSLKLPRLCKACERN